MSPKRVQRERPLYPNISCHSLDTEMFGAKAGREQSRTKVVPCISMSKLMWIFILFELCAITNTAGIRTPPFTELVRHYPGYAHYGGIFHNHQLIEFIGCDTSGLLRDTSALRLSVALNGIGGVHSLGRQLIQLSRYGHDSVMGQDGFQYIYHPIAYGPYFADKYGYPNISKVHEHDPLNTKKTFWGKQGVLRVITYPHGRNLPKGHVALWNCNHFHQSRDWISGHSRITVEFWESPDSDCSNEPPIPPPTYPDIEDVLFDVHPGAKIPKLRHHGWEKRFIKKYYQLHKASNEDIKDHGAL